jgi:hypothetical protein
MPKKETEYTTILIPADTANPDIQVVVFRHNGMTKYVPLGKPTRVPKWVVDRNPIYAKYEQKVR